jgi:hypothetical protein
MTSRQTGLEFGDCHYFTKLSICRLLLGSNSNNDKVNPECRLTAGSVVRIDMINNAGIYGAMERY